MLTVMFLEDEHGAQANSAHATATDVDTDTLGLGKELVALGGVPGDEGTLALAAKVLQMLGVLLGQTLQTSEEVVSGGGGVLDEVQTLDFLDDAAEDEGTGWVTHPGVELAVRLVGAQSGVTVVVACGLSLLREGHNVRRSLEVPVIVGPELAGGTDTGLHLVDDEEHIVALSDVAQALEEGRGGVVVTALGLDGLDDNGSNGVVELLDKALNLLQAALFLLSVLLGMLL